MTRRVPSLSRFEMQVLRLLGEVGTATVRDLHGKLPAGPSYSTVRKIVERLETKGAVVRDGRDGNAWIYRTAVSPSTVIRGELRRLLDSLFGGSGAPLVAHLLDMDAVTLADLRELERELERSAKRKRGGRRE